ncbi:MAG: adenylate cyclase, partial [Gammaproteobacteria bacterium]
MTKLSLTERRLRIITGLILASYIIIHLSNHLLGLISLEAMETMRKVITPFWRSRLGSLLIYGSLVTHFSLALMSLFRRTTLRMPAWELAQLLLGLSIFPLLAGHIAGILVSREVLGIDMNYERVLNVYRGDSWLMTRQLLLLLVAWSHVVIGLHFFFRLFTWYARGFYYLYPWAILLPLLVILSMARVDVELDARGATAVDVELDAREATAVESSYNAVYSAGTQAKSSASYDRYGAAPVKATPAWTVAALRDALLISFYGLLILTLLARVIKLRFQSTRGSFSLKHINGRQLKFKTGQTILEIIRRHDIPHASLCGGRGRCTTCRVRVGEGRYDLDKPSALEQFALNQIGAAADVRLACQTRPSKGLHITPLVEPDLHQISQIQKGGVSGEERQVLAMFVDLRDSTKLCEGQLPYDALFILNQFFVEMAAALNTSHGHYAQFAGDGLMALYGLERGLKQGCLDALQGAVDMQRRIDKLNQNLKQELKQPLRIGIGLHCGDAIVGTM